MTTTTEAPKTLEPVRFTCRRYVTTHTIAAYMTPPLVTNGNTNLESLIEHASAFRAFIKRCLDRHHQMDCGDMDAEDKATNDDALLSGARLFSSYNIPDELKRQSSEPGFNDDAFPNDNIWIITEAVDGLPNTRDLTTVLFPSEY